MPHKVELVSMEAIVMVDGKKVPLDNTTRATCVNVNWAAIRDPSEPLAIDVEFQDCKYRGHAKFTPRIGRVAVVNTRGETVYDVYANYPYDPEIERKIVPPEHLGFNVTWKDLALANGAREAQEVNDSLYFIMNGRTIIGHGVGNDVKALVDAWPGNHTLYDTQSYYGRGALKTVAADHLNETFDWHNPLDDARATMLLYLRAHPYNKRTNFFDDYRIDTKDDDDFPTLAAAATIKKNQ